MHAPTVILAVIVSALAACTSGSGKTSKAPTPANPNEVVIYNYKFRPQTLTVSVGATVTWINRDVAPHTATHPSFGDEPFDTGSLGHLAVFSHTFKIAGSYDYYCVLHQGMTGTIVVQ